MGASQVRLLWRFRSALPYIALSSALSIVLGAFSAMRHHYQAAVINLAKDLGAPGSGCFERGGVLCGTSEHVRLSGGSTERLEGHVWTTP